MKREEILRSYAFFADLKEGLTKEQMLEKYGLTNDDWTWFAAELKNYRPVIHSHDDVGFCKELYRSARGNAMYARMSPVSDSKNCPYVQWFTATDDWDEACDPLRKGVTVRVFDPETGEILFDETIIGDSTDENEYGPGIAIKAQESEVI